MSSERVFADDASRELWSRSDLSKILLTGLPRSGKTSILSVIFQKMSPYETVELLSCQAPVLAAHHIATNDLIQFAIGDAAGTLFMEMTSADSTIFSGVATVVCVVSAQNEPCQADIQYAAEVIQRGLAVNKNVFFEVLVHKVDGDIFCVVDGGALVDIQRGIQTNLMELLYELGIKEEINVNFYTTSIYDHTLFEAFSRIVQRLIPQVPVVEQLMNLLVSVCRMEKAFIFDVVSKLFIASDSSSVEMQSYDLCSDTIDVVIDVSCIYGRPTSQNQFDPSSNCVIHLDNRTILYVREIDKYLAFVCIIKDDFFDRQHLVDFNIGVFREAFIKTFHETTDTSLA